MNIAAQTWLPDLAPILTNPQEGRKVKPSPPLPLASRKTSRTCLASLKSAGSFFSPLFFFSFLFIFLLPPSKTVRPGAVKGPETEIQRGGTRLTPTTEKQTI